ncbi:MAG: SPASM domain-containing protein [Flavobacteriales bacterium]|nr:SPASM domain-containing protein [Flavobacteriales bacterium]
MHSAVIRDQWNFISKLSTRKIWNMLRTWISFHISRNTKNTIHPAMPVSISIEPTTACNLGCPECPSGLKMFSRETGNIKQDDAKKWLHEMAPFITYINFYFQGEPFIHPGFLDLVKLASSYNIYTSTSTNGHFLHDDLARKTVESGLDRLIISIDGTTQEVYEQYRIHGTLDKVLAGAKNIIRWKKTLKKNTPHVIFQFLVVKPNQHQIDDVRVLARELGVDEVRFKTAQVYDYQNGNVLIPTLEKYSRYRKNADGTYSVKNRLDNHCWRMWSGTVVTWDGKVVPCCFDKDASHQLGDLREQTLAEVWNSKKYRHFRESLFKNRCEIDICANCSEGTKVWA